MLKCSSITVVVKLMDFTFRQLLQLHGAGKTRMTHDCVSELRTLKDNLNV